MKQIIKLTENDIRRMVNEALNEISWGTTRDLYNKHNSGEYILSRLVMDIDTFLENFEADGTYEDAFKCTQQPISGKISEFMSMLEQYRNYFDKKRKQIDKFDQHSTEGFTKEFGKTPRELEDMIGDKDDDNFRRYMNDEEGFDYNSADRELRNTPEYQAVERYNGY